MAICALTASPYVVGSVLAHTQCGSTPHLAAPAAHRSRPRRLCSLRPEASQTGLPGAAYLTASTSTFLASVQALEATPQLSEGYAVGQQIGSGSFAVVLEVTDKHTGERLCAKKLPKFAHSRLPCHQSQVVAAEAEVQRVLSAASSCILRLRDLRQDDSFYYLISELCQSDLGSYLTGRGALSEREAAYITQQLLTALHTCHRHGVAYRDVKPANLLVRSIDSNGLPEVCLADFGCSRSILGPQPSNRSSPGTPLFSAPECVHGYGGCESDIWSAGVLLYNLLSGAFPFCDPRQKIGQAEYWQRVVEAPISYLGPGWREVSPRAVALARRMLDRDCSQRITAQEALQDGWLRGLSSSRTATTSWRGATATPGAPSAHELLMCGNVVPGIPHGAGCVPSLHELLLTTHMVSCKSALPVLLSP